jgi:undecaprenyl-diphosphatase
MFYTIFFGVLIFLARQWLPRAPARALALLMGSLVVLVGPSRIYLGAHWLSDVLAAYLLGAIMLAFAVEGYRAYLLHERQ